MINSILDKFKSKKNPCFEDLLKKFDMPFDLDFDANLHQALLFLHQGVVFSDDLDKWWHRDFTNTELCTPTLVKRYYKIKADYYFNLFKETRCYYDFNKAMRFYLKASQAEYAEAQMRIEREYIEAREDFFLLAQYHDIYADTYRSLHAKKSWKKNIRRE